MGIVPQRLGNEFGFAVPSNSYRCKDGWVYVAVLLDSHWKALAPILGHRDLAEDPNFTKLPNRLANRDACNAMVAAWAAAIYCSLVQAANPREVLIRRADYFSHLKVSLLTRFRRRFLPQRRQHDWVG
jgi:crotonobetainyl-CoA:carnitine CoA-transferase CaiB-like acyl-CoA transferase